MSVEPPHEPATGAERIFWRIAIVFFCLHGGIMLLVAMFSAEHDLHWINVVVPVGGILIARARLKGQVQQGFGGGGGGGP